MVGYKQWGSYIRWLVRAHRTKSIGLDNWDNSGPRSKVDVNEGLGAARAGRSTDLW